MRCRVRARGFLISPPSPPTKKDKLALTSAEQTPKERERTNKSARAVRGRDIVSCRGKSSLRLKNGLLTSEEPFCRLVYPPPILEGASRRDVCYLRARIRGTANPSPPSPLLSSSSSSSSYPSCFPRSRSVSVNMRTHGLVITVIGSLTPARRHPLRGSVAEILLLGMADFLVSLGFERDRLVIDLISR